MSKSRTSSPAPPDFAIHPVFIEIESAKYSMVVDLNAEPPHADVVSILTFHTADENSGHPIIDLSRPQSIVRASIDGTPTGWGRVDSPDHETQYVVFDYEVKPGTDYTAVIEHRLALARPDDSGVVCFFRMSHAKHYGADPTDRLFLERYLPCNVEFDQHPVLLEFSVEGAGEDELVVYTNGDVQSRAPWTIEFPDYFTSSSMFFFLGRQEKLRYRTFVVEVGGEEIDVTLFGHRRMLWRFEGIEKQVRKALPDLYERFGSPRTTRLTLMVGQHGIEYVGAAEVSGSNVYHELLHLYFGRGVMPADGNAGWIDEAIAHWAQMGYRLIETPPDHGSDMGNASQYRRGTSVEARKLGALFIGYLAFRLEDEGDGEQSMFDFLREFFGNRRQTTIHSSDFQADLKLYAKDLPLEDDIDVLFDIYVNGRDVHPARTAPRREAR